MAERWYCSICDNLLDVDCNPSLHEVDNHNGEDTTNKITVTQEVLDGVSKILSTPGWDYEQYVRFSGESVLQLRQGPRGRGHRREKYVIVASTPGDCLRMLRIVQELLDA